VTLDRIVVGPRILLRELTFYLLSTNTIPYSGY